MDIRSHRRLVSRADLVDFQSRDAELKFAARPTAASPPIE
jgi:hypothetical protein